jgi:hypothetical protein
MVLGIDYSSVSPCSCYSHSYRARLRGVHFYLPLLLVPVENMHAFTLQISNPATAEAKAIFHFFKLGVILPCRASRCNSKEPPSFEHSHVVTGLALIQKSALVRRDVIR